jgi:hypothetical protein
MSRFIAGGDSFTWGSELPDCNETSPSKLTWAGLLCDRMDMEYCCVAKPGAGNHSITRKVIAAIESSPADFVAVMWTYPVRAELRLREDLTGELLGLYDKHDIKSGDLDEGWLTLSIWQTIPYAEKINKYGMDHDPWFLNKIKQQCDFYDEIGVANLASRFFSLASLEHYAYDTIMNIFSLQSYLEKKDVPYVFAAATSEVLDIISNHPLGNLVNMDRWLNPEMGFNEWSRKQGHEISPMNHPVAAAHRDWLDHYDP